MPARASWRRLFVPYTSNTWPSTRSEPLMPIDVEGYRAEFPVLEKKAYLISASLGPVSNRARRYLDEYVDVWATDGAPDPVWMDHIFPQMARVKDTFAGLVGATRRELAITVNVSLALANVMSCIDFGARR